MYPPIREDVFAALIEAVRIWPNRWSLEAQAIVISLCAWLEPDNIEASLDAAEAIVRGSARAAPSARLRLSGIGQFVHQTSGRPPQECRVLPFPRRRRK